MKIIYHENPLATQIFLDEQEKEIFKLKLRVEEMEDFIYHYYFRVSDKHPTLNDKERAMASLESWINKNDENEDSDPFNYQYYLNELETGIHVGDCTCVPCSCSKCHAEGVLGFDSIKGLGKHHGSQIQGAFATAATCAEAIELLKKPYDMEPEEGKDKSWYTPEYISRWNREREETITWLINYQELNLAKEIDHE